MPPFRGRRAPPPRNSVASAIVDKKSEEEVGQLSALRRYDLVPPPFFAARGFVSAPLTLSSATFATSVLAIAVVFLARFGHSAPATSTSQKKSETASSVTPAGLGTKHFQNISQKFDSWQKQTTIGQDRVGGGTKSRRWRRPAGHEDSLLPLETRPSRARAHPPLDGGGRRGPRGRTSLAPFLLLEDEASKVASCGLPTRVWGQLTGRF